MQDGRASVSEYRQSVDVGENTQKIYWVWGPIGIGGERDDMLREKMRR